MIKMKIEGLKELDKALSELGKEFGAEAELKALRPALRQATKEMENDIRNRTNVDTGALRDSVKTSVKKTNKKDKGRLGQDAVIHAEVGYHWRGSSLKDRALSQEFGNSVTAANPVLRPAIDRHAGSIINTFKSALGKSIIKKANQLRRKLNK